MLGNAKEYAQRLKKKGEEYSFETVGKVTISMGIVEIEPVENINEIFKRVDDLLYTRLLAKLILRAPQIHDQNLPIHISN